MNPPSANQSNIGPAPAAAERRKLRSRANQIKASLVVGRQGLSEAFLRKIRQMFDRIDLLKVRLDVANAVESDEMASALAKQVPCHLVGRVGHVAVLYRPLPEKDRE
ncbi:MAG TPA: YhbY family RNA-binding protein [Phycisphaerae bacterium]|nr:YhbY family RNA-binding protein [Phycisphaerae bacterium]